MKHLERRPLEWMDEAPVRVSVTREIDATAEAVWEVIADHERWPEWFDGLTSVEVTGAAEGVGGQRRVRVRGLGAFDEEFIVWEPGRAFGFSVTRMQRPIFASLNELITLEPIDSARVRATYEQAIAPRWWSRPIVAAASRRSMPNAVAAGLDGLAERARRR